VTDKRNEKILLTAAALNVVAILISHLLWMRTRLPGIPALYPYLTLAALVCTSLWARFRFHRLAQDEERDRAALQPESTRGALFASTDDPEIDPISYIHARRQFEKWFIPLLAPISALLVGFWGYRLYAVGAQPFDEPTQRLFAAAVLIGQAFALFLFGRYFLGLSRAPADRWLRGPGNLLLGAALASALTGAAAIVAELGYPVADRWVRQGLAVYLWVLATEYVINTIGFLYRPKRQDAQVVTYESRITALLTDPQSWTSNLAQTLDYQFGFQVSETGFYRFMRRALLPLVLVQILLLYALSCIVVLGPEEAALLERLGNPLTPDGEPRILSSGVHFKWPWPFDTVRRHPARRILTAHIGYEKDPDEPIPPMILWTQPHFPHEDQFIVANRELMAATDEADAAVPVNFMTVNVPIEYRITNLYDYIYNHGNPDELLRLAAHRLVTRELASRDFIEVLGIERLAAGRRLFSELQREAEVLGLGVEILFVGLHGAHPPIPVADAFEDVVGALEERETAILEANAYQNRVLPLAGAEGDEVLWQARSARAQRVERAAAEADRFATRLAIHQDLPRIYTSRLYLETLNRALGSIDKYVIATSPDLEVIILNWEEQLRPDLFDFTPGRMEDRFL